MSRQGVMRRQRAMRRQTMCSQNVRECVVTMRRQELMHRQRDMRRQERCRHNALSGGNASSGKVSSQCVVSVSAKSHIQAAGALEF